MMVGALAALPTLSVAPTFSAHAAVTQSVQFDPVGAAPQPAVAADPAMAPEVAPAQAAAPAALDHILEQAQSMIDLSATMQGAPVGPAASPVQFSQGASALAGSSGIDLSNLTRAYDFAMRSYLMTKVVSEATGGLKSLWQAQ